MSVSSGRKSTGDGHRRHGKRATRTQRNNQVFGRLRHQKPSTKRSAEHGNARTTHAVVERRQIRHVRQVTDH